MCHVGHLWGDLVTLDLVESTVNPSPAALIAGEVLAKEAVRPLSVFDMFRIGIGPSSSHTVGPMRAGLAFSETIGSKCAQVGRINIELFGSLGATGRGHSTDRAVLLGLAGYDPEDVPTQVVEGILPQVAATGEITLAQGHRVPFDIERDLHFVPRTVLPYHVNALTITAFDRSGTSELLRRTYYSVGGGFVMEEQSPDPSHPKVHALTTFEALELHSTPAPYPFTSGQELLKVCEETGLSVAQVVRANEEAARPGVQVDAYLDRIYQVMRECVQAGCQTRGILPGGLDVPRRASALAAEITRRQQLDTGQLEPVGKGQPWAGTSQDAMRAMEWVNLYALAVNEENAAGHRVVTAPTNGAAGVVPAVLGYLVHFCPEGKGQGGRKAVHDFLLAATAIGALIKTNASIAGAEVGCQGEVGSASSMAAAGLCQAFGGNAHQVENAAEIAMEHNLGLTCDPVGGLVQVPCIERNAIAAVKSINAARMAMWGDGRHTVSFDAVIETMRQTGKDMLSKYKETSQGGLAVNVVEC